jgi:hypothetical protein
LAAKGGGCEGEEGDEGDIQLLAGAAGAGGDYPAMGTQDREQSSEGRS